MRLIFDVDNTLIIWKDEYDKALINTIKKHNLNIDYNDINKLLDEYEKKYTKYDKELLVDFLNKNLKEKINLSFINDWLEELEDCADIEDGLIDTLEYLSKKYELVILTNWFKEPQIKRLRYVKIDKYFTEIYGGEECIKPSKESYLKAIGNHDIKDCIMIGDNYDIDIKGALDIGMKVILIGNKRNDITTIKNINVLKEML